MNHTDEFLRMANEARTRITEISPAEARKKKKEGVIIIDVREKEEFETGHIDGALKISRGTLESRIGEIVPDKETSIVCHCGGGNRGALAADTLQKMGYTCVASIQGGLKAFQADEKK